MKLQNTKDRVFSDQEVSLICQWFRQAGHPAAADLLVFLLETAARWGEAEALRGEDVDLVKGRVTFSKTKANRVRSVPLTKRALQALEGHIPAIGAHKVWPYTYNQYRRLLQTAKAWASVLKRHSGSTRHATRQPASSQPVASPFT
jgi:integrase